MNQHERGRAIRRAEGITWRDKVVLCELNDIQGNNASGWTSLTKIARDLGINRSNFYRILSDLVERGWLERSKNEDGKPAFSVVVPDAPVVSEQHQSSVETTPERSVETTPPVVSEQHLDGVKTTPEKCQNNTSSFNAQERPRTPSERVAPTPRSHPADFAGQPADEARAALNAALKAAGHAPKPRGGWSTQGAWQQVACDAAELAQETGNTVAHVLEVSAAGFVAAKGAGGHPTWWAEDVARYFDEGRKGAPRKRGEMAPIGVGFVGTSDDELEAMFGPLREVQA